MKMILRIPTLTLFLLMSASTWAAPVDLVKGGKAVSEIIMDKDANQSVKLAAKDLQDYLKRISGAELKIVNTPTPDVKNHIYVGESEFTKKLGFKPAKFNNSGFEIVAKDNYVILTGADRISKVSPVTNDLKKWQDFCGEKFGLDHVNDGLGEFNPPLKLYANDDAGTWYAASELLEQLGVRFYAPYDNGTVVPEMKDISIAEQTLKSEAAFARREWLCYGMRMHEESIAWLKRMKCGSHTAILNNHTTYAIYAKKEQKELHPEYLACDAAGTPYPGYPAGVGMPRFGNQDFRRASTVFMNKVLEALPDLSSIAVGQPDGGIKVDARDINLYEKSGDPVGQGISNCYWDYNVFLAKELKKSHPDKSLLYLVYGEGVRMLPSNMKSDDHDNMVMAFAQPYSAYCVVQSTRKPMLDERHKWLNAMKQKSKSPIWDYFLYYISPGHPRFPIFFTEYLQQEMKEMLPYADGKFIELQSAAMSNGLKDQPGMRLGEPALIHLMMYWQNKLLWNPDADRKTVLEEYYRLYFGPAAAEMKEFHEFAEKVWTRQESRSVTQSTGFLKEPDIEKYFEILSRARGKAGKDSVYDKRIAAMEDAYKPLKKFFADLQRKGPEIRGCTVPNETKLDGDVTKYKDGWNKLRDKVTGEFQELNRTDVNIALTEDGTALYIAAVCYEDSIGKIRANTKLNDTVTIFDDDVIEVYINTPERSYFKIVVNPNGAVWDESTDVSIIDRDTLQILWNPGIKAVVKKFNDRWTVEIMVPTKDLGKIGPTKKDPWGIQIGRTRFSGNDQIWSALGPGKGPYATLTQWGNLWIK